MGRHRLPPLPGGLDPGVGLDRRPDRHQEGVPVRARRRSRWRRRCAARRTSLNELVAFRVLQGVGGGMLVPVGTAMLFRAFPPIERATRVDDPHHPDRPRARARPDHRRLARHRRVVALDLLRQPAGRRLRLRRRRSLPQGAPRSRRPGAFDVPGFVLSGIRARARCCTRCRRDPRRAGRSHDHPRHRRSADSRCSALLVLVETHVPRPDARAAPLQGTHVPQRQPGARAHVRKLRRRPLPPAALPAGAARAHRAAVGPDHVPAGDRRR